MPLPSSQVNETLASLLRGWARSASDGTLALAAAAGLLAAIGTLLWRPHGWISVVSLAGGLAAFGVFGIADRELMSPLDAPSPAAHRTWRAIRVGAMLLGVASGFGLLLVLMTVLLGTWIS